MRFKVGDRVRIKQRKELDPYLSRTDYGQWNISFGGRGFGISQIMLDYCGKEVFIKSVSDETDRNFYRIQLGDDNWYFLEEMLEDPIEIKKNESELYEVILVEKKYYIIDKKEMKCVELERHKRAIMKMIRNDKKLKDDEEEIIIKETGELIKLINELE